MHWLKTLQFTILAIGIILSGLAYAEDEDEVRFKKGLVYVEPSAISSVEIEQEYSLVPYVDRRNKWGSAFSVGYSSYQPSNYEPDFSPVDFSDVYTSAELPLIELLITAKRNLSMGSIGVELGIGTYQNQSDDKELSDSSLTLIPVRLGASFYLDTLTPNPNFVPYVAGGMYTIFFKEELDGGSSHNGNTELAAYFHGGVAFGLGWIDPEGARLGFQESGLEATYVYLELQKYMASANTADGDFSNDVSYAGGIKIEF
jgi:hypothetical protein